MSNLAYIDNDYARGWMQNDFTSRNFVKLRLAYIDICDGNFYDATLLSAIMYWHEPSAETGKTRLSRFRDGHLWITKNHSDWYDDCRLKASTVRKCMERLKELGIIYYELHGEKGLKTPWIRMNWATFEKLMKEWVADNTPVTVGQGSDMPGQGVCPTVTAPLLQQDEPNTKNTTENTTKNTSIRADARDTAELRLVEKPKEQPKPEPKGKPQGQAREEYIFALQMSWEVTNKTAAMLFSHIWGTTKDPERIDNPIEKPLTVEQVYDFPKWWKQNYSKASMPMAADKLPNWIVKYHAANRKITTLTPVDVVSDIAPTPAAEMFDPFAATDEQKESA